METLISNFSEMFPILLTVQFPIYPYVYIKAVLNAYTWLSDYLEILMCVTTRKRDSRVHQGTA